MAVVESDTPAILGQKAINTEEQLRCYWNISGYTVHRMVKLSTTPISPETCWPTLFSLEGGSRLGGMRPFLETHGSS